jgi:hypothetical protein
MNRWCTIIDNTVREVEEMEASRSDVAQARKEEIQSK